MTPLCKVNEIVEGTCYEFEWHGHPCFLVRHRGRLLAYRNYCPHRGVTLNWRPDDFFTESGDELRCATHDAHFRVEDGLCVAGPCAGESLVALPVVVVAGICFIVEASSTFSNGG